MKKRLYIPIVWLISLLVLTSCGGVSETISNQNGEMLKCTTGTFSMLKKGDIVSILVDDTEIDIRHTQDGKKKACILSGKAKIN